MLWDTKKRQKIFVELFSFIFAGYKNVLNNETEHKDINEREKKIIFVQKNLGKGQRDLF